AADRAGAASCADPARPGRVSARPNPGGTGALLHAPPCGCRALAEQPASRRSEGNSTAPQRVLLAVMASEQRDNDLATRTGAPRSATPRPLGDLVAIVDGRAFAGGGSGPSGGQG